MVRLCSKSSRSYSGRPVTRACRQRWDWPPAMALRREQESAEAIVPRATSRKTKTGRTHNPGRAELGRQTRPSVVLSPGDEAESAELRAAIIVAEKECCVIPQGLPGTAVCGPACTVVWEPGGETLPATRLGGALMTVISVGVAVAKQGQPDRETRRRKPRARASAHEKPQPS